MGQIRVVYSSECEFLIMLGLFEDSKNNEQREGIFDSLHAQFKTNKAIVIDLINKISGESLEKLDGEKYTYEKGAIIYSYDYCDDINQNNGINYYLTRDTAFYKDIKNYTGIFCSWYPNGSKKRMGYLRDDLKEGLHEVWYPSHDSLGKKCNSGYWKNCKKYGKHESWYSDGSKCCTSEWVDGIENGKFEEWHENGKLWRNLTFVNGMEEGLITSWFPDGNKWIEGSWKEGKQHGVHTLWYQDGQIRESGEWENGNMVGIHESWHPAEKETNRPGGLHVRGEWKNGHKIGCHKSWYDGIGTIQSIENWNENGEQNGMSESWYFCEKDENFIQKMSAGNWVNGKKDGLHCKWYPDGKNMERGKWINGKEDGMHRLWHANGELHESENWIEGVRDGLHEIWDENNKIQMRILWKNGDIESEEIHFE
jgi:antitoxin component YwqK of YwqJK toxin-antitoxin module